VEGSAVRSDCLGGEPAKTGQRTKEKSRVLDSGLKNMSESWSSLITGRRRCKAKASSEFFKNQQPISVGV
jgi:hypothetical protein